MPKFWDTSRVRVADAAHRLRDDRGNIAVLAAGMLSMLIALTAISVDAGHLHFKQKDLQRVADQAALAASLDTSRAQELVLASLASNGFDAEVLQQVRVGEYDPFASLGNRFRPDQGDNAVEVVLRNQVTMAFFGAIGGSDNLEIEADAVAAYIPEVGFSASSGVLNAQITNNLLGALTGNNLNLSTEEYNALAEERVDILDVLDDVAEQSGSDADTYQELLDDTISAGTLVGSLANVLGLQPGVNGTALGAVETVAAMSGLFSMNVPMGDLVDLGTLGARPIGDPDRRTDASTGFRALDVMMHSIQIAGAGELIDLGLVQNIPGLIDVNLYVSLDRGSLSGGVGSGGAPLVVGPKGTHIHASAGRVLLDVNLFGSGGLFGFLSVHLPLYVELGGADVTLTDVDCGFDPSQDTVMTFETSSSLSRAYIADIDPNDIANGPVINPGSVEILNIGLIHVDAFAAIDVLGSGAQQVTMTVADIEAGNTALTGNEQTFGSLFSSLQNELSLSVGFGGGGGFGGGLGGGLITGIVLGLVGSVTSTLDPLVFSILNSLGLRAGYVELAPSDVRCGTPVIVI